MLFHHALDSATPLGVTVRRGGVGPLLRRVQPTRGESVSPAAASSDIDLRVTSDLAGLEETWRAFENEADGTVFQTFDWLSRWQRHIGSLGGTVPAVVTGRDADGDLLFLLPLAVERRRFARRLTWLGTDLCDYNGPLLGRRFAERFGAAGFAELWPEILRLLRTDPRLHFDYVDLPKMLDTVGAQPNPFFGLAVQPNVSGAYVATLGTEWDAFYAAQRSGPTRKKERRQLKQLAEHGEVRFVEVGEPEAIARSMATLFEQKSHAFAGMGVADNFARPGYRAFYLDVTTDPRASDIVHVSRLDVGGTVAAVSLGLRFGGTYYLVLSSYQDGDLARFGPGRAHLNELLRYAVASHFRRFDFTIGDEPYKRDWSDVVLRPHDHLQSATIRGSAIVSTMIAFRVAKRFIKQTPVLWRAFSKARAFKAALSGRAGQPKAAADAAE